VLKELGRRPIFVDHWTSASVSRPDYWRRWVAQRGKVKVAYYGIMPPGASQPDPTPLISKDKNIRDYGYGEKLITPHIFAESLRWVRQIP
jgi:hypothetical protein